MAGLPINAGHKGSGKPRTASKLNNPRQIGVNHFASLRALIVYQTSCVETCLDLFAMGRTKR